MTISEADRAVEALDREFYALMGEIVRRLGGIRFTDSRRKIYLAFWVEKLNSPAVQHQRKLRNVYANLLHLALFGDVSEADAKCNRYAVEDAQPDERYASPFMVKPPRGALQPVDPDLLLYLRQQQFNAAADKLVNRRRYERQAARGGGAGAGASSSSGKKVKVASPLAELLDPTYGLREYGHDKKFNEAKAGLEAEDDAAARASLR